VAVTPVDRSPLQLSLIIFLTHFGMQVAVLLPSLAACTTSSYAQPVARLPQWCKGCGDGGGAGVGGAAHRALQAARLVPSLLLAVAVVTVDLAAALPDSPAQ
jgi:hypothetical protein